MQITAVPAPPDHDLLAFENQAGVDIRRKIPVTLFMLLFGDGNSFPNLGCGLETLLARDAGKTWIHFTVLILFPVGRGKEILHGCANDTCGKSGSDLHLAALQELEKALGMLLFLVRRLLENIGNLNEAVLACPAK